MKKLTSLFAIILLSSVAADAAALGTSARSVIPSEIQQIIVVDYRKLSSSATATELKDRVLPENLREFEKALQGVGINPGKDMEQLVFASFRKGDSLRFIGVAQGQFSMLSLAKQMKQKKTAPTSYHNSLIYPMGNGLVMSLLDDNTMLFGENPSVKNALEARDGDIPSLNSNTRIADLMADVDSASVWSVLDPVGTQTMLRTALGDAAGVADYEAIKKRLLGSHYKMEFASGVDFDLDVVTSDTMSAATLSSLVRVGMQLKKINATPAEKAFLESMDVDSDSGTLKLHFKADDQRFEALLHSDLFNAAVR